jgi:hypothetical protein
MFSTRFNLYQKKFRILVFFLLLSSFYSSQTRPHLTGVLINSCEGLCNEGDNELVFGTSGDYSILANTTNLDLFYNTTSPASTNYVDNLTTVPATTTALNTAVGCAGTFIEGTGATIPPNAKFMIVKNTLCPAAYNWTSFCGEGPIYVIYSTDITWVSGGNFVNGGTNPTIRYFRTTIRTTDAVTTTIDYNYNAFSLVGGNGSYVTFDSDGGVATTYLNNGCGVDPIILPIELIDFIGYYTNGINRLEWSVASERDNDYYVIEKSLDGLKWDIITQINGYGTTTTQQDYYTYDNNIETELNYYKLSQVDFNGSKTELKIIAIDNKNKIFDIIKITNIIGQEVDNEYIGVKLFHMSNGEIIKKY